MENPIKMDDSGVSLFLETPIFIYDVYIYIEIHVSPPVTPRTSHKNPSPWHVTRAPSRPRFQAGQLRLPEVADSHGFWGHVQSNEQREPNPGMTFHEILVG